MKKIILTWLALSAALVAAWQLPAPPAFAFWQSRDSNYNSAIPASGPILTYIGTSGSVASGAGLTYSAPLGSNPACLVVVATDYANGTASITQTVTVGGVSLNQDKYEYGSSSGYAGIYSGVLSNCTGSQNVVLSSSAGNFDGREVSVWVLTHLVSNTVIQTTGYAKVGGSGSPSTISVTAGDLMLGAEKADAPASCTGSTQTPNDTYTATVNIAEFDWKIVSTNASFNFNCNISNDLVAAAATYH